MINKITNSIAEALADIKDGSTVMIGGFGGAGQPTELIDGLIAQGARNLTVVNNNAGNGEIGLAALLKAGQVRKNHLLVSAPGGFANFRRPLSHRKTGARTGATR